MHVVDVDLLPEPHSGPDSNAPQPMEGGPDAAASGSHVRDLLKESLNESRQEHDPTNDTGSGTATSVPVHS